MGSLRIPDEKILNPKSSALLYRQSPNRYQQRSPIKKPLKPWKKLLYLNQRYPDNYTNESFLSQLKRNTTVAKYSYWKLVDDFSLIVFHLSNLLLVILIFTGIYLHLWNPLRPTILSSCFSVLGYIVFRSISNGLKNSECSIKKSSDPYKVSNPKPNSKSFLLLIFILLVLSPVLKSLTRSTSSDSIWALSFMLFLSNTIFHDYAMDISINQYKPILSTNISLSNAIVLASRLNSNVQVFCFILLAIQINILLPLFDFSIRKYCPNKLYHRTLVIVLLNVVYYLIDILWGFKILLVWIFLQASISLLMPAYFLFLQKYKNELQGPWDPAKPIINSN